MSLPTLTPWWCEGLALRQRIINREAFAAEVKQVAAVALAKTQSTSLGFVNSVGRCQLLVENVCEAA